MGIRSGLGCCCGQFRPSCGQFTLWADNVIFLSYLPTTRLGRLYIYIYIYI